MAERVSVAGACVRRLKIQFPALVDGLEDRVEAAYTGWPDRMYLIDRGGSHKITDVYVGGVSMKVTERDEFASVIQRNGGQVAALLAQLRQKLAAS